MFEITLAGVNTRTVDGQPQMRGANTLVAVCEHEAWGNEKRNMQDTRIDENSNMGLWEANESKECMNSELTYYRVR